MKRDLESTDLAGAAYFEREYGYDPDAFDDARDAAREGRAMRARSIPVTNADFVSATSATSSDLPF